VEVVAFEALARGSSAHADGRLFNVQRGGDLRGDLVLHGEHVRDAAVEASAPQVVAIRDVDELRGHTEPFSRGAHASFQDRLHPQLPPDLPDVHVATLESERRGTRRDVQPVDLAQHVEDFLGETVTELLLVTLAREIDEREDSDGAGSRSRGRFRHVGRVSAVGGGTVGRPSPASPELPWAPGAYA
jgi:hypothetical protein